MITTNGSTKRISLIKKIPEWVFFGFPILAAFFVWFGATNSGFTPDDYMVVDVQSPIRYFVDVISMFWRHDPNPQYWRPLTDSSVSFDFWLWGWNGGMFHLTNLLLHCLAVALVYIFVQKVFSFSSFAACLLAMLFGVSGSHDSNLLWIAARSDVIATIMMLCVFLTAFKTERPESKKWLWLTLSYISFFLALCSKEVNVTAIVLLPLLIYTSSIKELWQKKIYILKRLLPYFTLTALFVVIRSQYTIPLSDMQPLTAEGSHSIIAFAKNFLFSLGYIVAPVDFQLASFIINRYAAIGYVAAVVFFAGIIFLIRSSSDKTIMKRMYKPIILTLITGFVSFQSFERWRVYLPSVGVIAIIFIIFSLLWKKESAKAVIRPALIVLALGFAIFHIHKSIESQSVNTIATAHLIDLGRDLQTILTSHPQRPIVLELITSPTKLGGAGMIQLSKNFLARKAEADRIHFAGLEYGVVEIPDDTITLISDIDMYALDPEKGFGSLVIKKIGTDEYEVSGDKDEIGLFPAIGLIDGKARRDTKLEAGAVYQTYGTDATIEKAESSFASHIKLKIRDTSAVHIYFDGKRIRELE